MATSYRYFLLTETFCAEVCGRKKWAIFRVGLRLTIKVWETVSFKLFSLLFALIIIDWNHYYVVLNRQRVICFP